MNDTTKVAEKVELNDKNWIDHKLMLLMAHHSCQNLVTWTIYWRIKSFERNGKKCFIHPSSIATEMDLPLWQIRRAITIGKKHNLFELTGKEQSSYNRYWVTMPIDEVERKVLNRLSGKCSTAYTQSAQPVERKVLNPYRVVELTAVESLDDEKCIAEKRIHISNNGVGETEKEAEQIDEQKAEQTAEQKAESKKVHDDSLTENLNSGKVVIADSPSSSETVVANSLNDSYNSYNYVRPADADLQPEHFLLDAIQAVRDEFSKSAGIKWHKFFERDLNVARTLLNSYPHTLAVVKSDKFAEYVKITIAECKERSIDVRLELAMSKLEKIIKQYHSEVTMLKQKEALALKVVKTKEQAKVKEQAIKVEQKKENKMKEQKTEQMVQADFLNVNPDSGKDFVAKFNQADLPKTIEAIKDLDPEFRLSLIEAVNEYIPCRSELTVKQIKHSMAQVGTAMTYWRLNFIGSTTVDIQRYIDLVNDSNHQNANKPPQAEQIDMYSKAEIRRAMAFTA